MQSYDMVIRAEGRLVNLIGLARKVDSFGHSSAAFWTWLDRYERAMTTPVDPLRSESRLIKREDSLSTDTLHSHGLTP